ncbi:Hpt domain-containing protein [Geomonas subterranea]|uniref:Hpt domain-containing protein n=1 Tax=Geomonas subterranea TaxID=2847989 RepID=UPI001EF00597|nr:Hpt domain-containing protein [Geomonas subterranea]
MLDSDALLKELLATFELEAREHLGELSSLLLSLERETEAAGRNPLLEAIFRRVHTLKGAAHAVNFPDVALACQRLEDVLAGLKRGDLALGLEQFDSLHASVNALSDGLFRGLSAAAALPAPSPEESPPLPAPPTRAVPHEAPEVTVSQRRQVATPVQPRPTPPPPARVPGVNLPRRPPRPRARRGTRRSVSRHDCWKSFSCSQKSWFPPSSPRRPSTKSWRPPPPSSPSAMVSAAARTRPPDAA